MMKLDRVTITGADDYVKVSDLIDLSQRFSFVEFGILFSANRTGTPRYPSWEWVEDLFASYPDTMNLSAHLCGRLARATLVDADDEFIGLYEAAMFKRIQLNGASSYIKDVDNPKLFEYIDDIPHQFIMQIQSEEALDLVNGFDLGSSASVVFDTSGGTGESPNGWPEANTKLYCGFAGGLGPHNVESEVGKLLAIPDDRHFWIDMESHIRVNDKFNMNRVVQVLETLAPFVTV
jgi:hypothetical protein